MPPAPAAEKIRVAARPAIVIWYEARVSSRRLERRVVDAAEDPPEERHVGAEGRDVEADRDHHPVPGGARRSCRACPRGRRPSGTARRSRPAGARRRAAPRPSCACPAGTPGSVPTWRSSLSSVLRSSRRASSYVGHTVDLPARPPSASGAAREQVERGSARPGRRARSPASARRTSPGHRGPCRHPRAPGRP